MNNLKSFSNLTNTMREYIESYEKINDNIYIKYNSDFTPMVLLPKYLDNVMFIETGCTSHECMIKDSNKDSHKMTAVRVSNYKVFFLICDNGNVTIFGRDYDNNLVDYYKEDGLSLIEDLNHLYDTIIRLLSDGNKICNKFSQIINLSSERGYKYQLSNSGETDFYFINGGVSLLLNPKENKFSFAYSIDSETVINSAYYLHYDDNIFFKTKESLFLEKVNKFK